jgi:hypothetical protein
VKEEEEEEEEGKMHSQITRNYKEFTRHAC